MKEPSKNYKEHLMIYIICMLIVNDFQYIVIYFIQLLIVQQNRFESFRHKN